MHRRTRIRLGQDQPVSRSSKPLHLGRQLNFFCRTALAAENPETTAVDYIEISLLAALRQRVLAVAQKRKVLVDHPVQKCLGLLTQQRVNAYWAVFYQVSGLTHALAHFAPG